MSSKEQGTGLGPRLWVQEHLLENKTLQHSHRG